MMVQNILKSGRQLMPFGGRADTLRDENDSLRELLNRAAIDSDRLHIDVVASEDAARFQRLLVEELHHRAKNMLAMVMAIASQSLNNSATKEAAHSAIESRLVALGRAQDVLLKTHSTTAQLSEIIVAAIEPFDDASNPRFIVDVDAITLNGEAIVPLTLLLNELCTNAVKYGALSVKTGRIAITARAEPEHQRYKLTWIETAGPPVRQPARLNFGSRLISSLARQLHGEARILFEPEGVVYELDASL